MTNIWNDDHTKCWQGCGDNRNSHSLMVRRQNDAAILEDSLVVPYKIKHTLNIGPSNHGSCHLLEETENVCPHKNLHMDLCSNFIYNCQNLEATKYPSIAAAAAPKSRQSYLTLCDPMDGSPPGSSVPGILQARMLECVAISFSHARTHAKSLQSCPTLCDPMDSSPPGSSVHRIL